MTLEKLIAANTAALEANTEILKLALAANAVGLAEPAPANVINLREEPPAPVEEPVQPEPTEESTEPETSEQPVEEPAAPEVTETQPDPDAPASDATIEVIRATYRDRATLHKDGGTSSAFKDAFNALRAEFGIDKTHELTEAQAVEFNRRLAEA